MKRDKTFFKEQVAVENLRHKHKMEEIKVETDGKIEVEKMKFDHQMQLQRFRTAGIQRTIEKKANIDFMRDKK